MRETDIKEVCALERRSFSFDNAFRKRPLRSWLEAPKTLAAVCYDGSRLLGHVIGYRERSSLCLLSLAVDYDYRRIRVGSTLLYWLAKNSAKKLKRMICMVPDDNLGAHLFLKAVGFKALEVVPDYFSFKEGCFDGYKFEYDLR